MNILAATLLIWTLLPATPADAAGEPTPLRTERIHPQTVVTPHFGAQNVKPENMAQIQFFLAQGHRILDVETPDQTAQTKKPGAGFILHAVNGRSDITQGEEVFVSYPEPLAMGTTLDIFRPGPELKAPETKKPLGTLLFRLGTLRVTRTTPQGTLATVTASLQTIHVGDQLSLPKPVNTEFTIHAQAPAPLSGRIVSIQNNLTEVGAGDVVVVGVGRRDRALQGLSLPVYRTGQSTPDSEITKNAAMPDQYIGHAILFQIGDQASFAFLEKALQPIRLGDTIRTP